MDRSDRVRLGCLFIISPQMNHQAFDVLHQGFEDLVGLDHERVARLRLFLNVALARGLTFLLGRVSDALREAGFLRLIFLVSDLR